MNAHAINAGRFPNISNGQYTDFFFINTEQAETIPELMVNLVCNRLPKAYNYPAKEIQILTPMQRGEVGAANLNIMLQSAINPSGKSLTRAGYQYRLGDKVMQIRNNYDKSVFNGDIGYITSLDEEDRTLQVTFDEKSVEYDVTELDELVLAYAITIHKSQGSEFPIVIIPVTMKHFVMLQRNLIYTGITRAKKICVLVGTTKALGYAVRNNPVCDRNTRLKERLQNG
jgi:exodeoxyribonuclease V alpha subunit